MAVKIFDDMLLKGVRSGKLPGRTEEARNWYRNLAKEYTKINESQLMRGGGERLTTRPRIGSMYMYYYDAKHKDTLPYFDQFPLVFPFSKTQNGFMGINLHYLPYELRAKLMDALYDVANNKNFDEDTKLKLNYQVLNSASKFRYFKPTVKQYLTTQLRSRFLTVHASEWDLALFLPTERFTGASNRKVWADSKKIIGKL
jgi:hypothetical protein